ncbi:MAG: hypothetical protein ACM3OO_08570 [Planctomycetaceae bacterium]
MDEYAALAQRVALTLDDVRGCLVLSRDGLVLGAHPEEEESSVKQAWLRFVHVGEPRKSFVEFGDQVWGYVHRGPYAAFIVSGASVRPGVLLDQLEQVLLTAEESRTKRESLKIPDAASAPSGKPRTTLHPPAAPPQSVPVAAVPEADPFVAAGGAPAAPPEAPLDVAAGGPAEPAVPVAPGAAAPEAVAPEPAPPEKDKKKDKDKDKKGASGLGKEPQRLVSSGWVTGDDAGADEQQEDPSEIDRVLLAKEFSGLLQLDETGDEGSS